MIDTPVFGEEALVETVSSLSAPTRPPFEIIKDYSREVKVQSQTVRKDHEDRYTFDFIIELCRAHAKPEVFGDIFYDLSEGRILYENLFFLFEQLCFT